MSKVAIITGAAQGIGKAIALRLAADGNDIALNDVRAQESKLAALASEIHALGRKTAVVAADVSDELEVEKMVNETAAGLGSVDVMVANAGICEPSPLLLTTTEQWDKHQSVNLRGVFLCFKFAAKQMIQQGRGGRIIGGTSLAGYSGVPTVGAYAASKGGIRTLTHTAAREWGSHGITVNSYAPGLIVTDLTFGMYGEAVIEEQKKTCALGVNGTPADVAGLVSFLASKDASFITDNDRWRETLHMTMRKLEIMAGNPCMDIHNDDSASKVVLYLLIVLDLSIFLLFAIFIVIFLVKATQ